MADMDWGWKRKKRTGSDLYPNNAVPAEDISDEELDGLMDLIYQNNDNTLDVSKKNLGSVLKNYDDKKSLASLARVDEVSSKYPQYIKLWFQVFHI